jgi:DnaJ-class molecular chaperone
MATKCKVCNGSGIVYDGGAVDDVAKTCPECNGTGQAETGTSSDQKGGLRAAQKRV